MLGPVGSLMLLLASQPVEPGTVQIPPEGLRPIRLICSSGPLERTFAGQQTSVYGCSDGRSLLIVSEKKNAAAHFEFTMFARGDRHVVGGTGSGDGTVVAAAYQELNRLSREEIEAMIRATRSR